MTENNISPEDSAFNHLDDTGQFSTNAINKKIAKPNPHVPLSKSTDVPIPSITELEPVEPPLISMEDVPMYAPGTPVLEGINPVGHTPEGEPIYAHITSSITRARLVKQGIHFAPPKATNQRRGKRR